jgi:hypothetical protein
MASPYEEDDGDDVPLQHKRPFGAGLKRKKVEFVKASSPTLATTAETARSEMGKAVSASYLSLVLPEKPGPQRSSMVGDIPETVVSSEQVRICNVCNLPVNTRRGSQEDNSKKEIHEASIAHQVCLTHSHPPSAIDRGRMGLAYLQSRGWDPDSRQGLGIERQGIQFPIKVKPKDDKLGLGLVIPKESRTKVEKKKPQSVDAKQRRQQVERDRQKTEKLRQLFYGNEDVDRYLGSGTEQ